MIEHREVWDCVIGFESVLIDRAPWAVLRVRTTGGVHKAIHLPLDVAQALVKSMDAELNPPATGWKPPTQETKGDA